MVRRDHEAGETQRVSYTPKLLKQFDRLTRQLESRNQLMRLDARLIKIPEFIAKHGREVCDEMFAELQRRDRRAGRG